MGYPIRMLVGAGEDADEGLGPLGRPYRGY